MNEHLHNQEMRVVNVERDALEEVVDALILSIDAIDEVFVSPTDHNL